MCTAPVNLHTNTAPVYVLLIYCTAPAYMLHILHLYTCCLNTAPVYMLHILPLYYTVVVYAACIQCIHAAYAAPVNVQTNTVCVNALLQRLCAEKEGSLVSAHSPLEYNFLQRLAKTGGHTFAWLGGYNFLVSTHSHACTHGHRHTHTCTHAHRHTHTCMHT